MTQCIQLSADSLRIITFEEAVIHGCGKICAHSMVIKNVMKLLVHTRRHLLLWYRLYITEEDINRHP
jgi:hypothetical protein